MDRYVVAITWLRALKIYWAYAWRAFLLGLALGIAVVVIFTVLGPLFRILPRAVVIVMLVALGLAVIVSAAAWSMKRALQVRYADFAIDVTPVDPASTVGVPTTATLTPWNALPVFWAMAWRGWLIYFPLYLLLSYLIDTTPLPTATVDWSNSFLLMATTMVVHAATSTWALRIALKLDYGNWHVQLVPAEPAPLATSTLSAEAGSSPQ